jgi:glucose repression mediator protein
MFIPLVHKHSLYIGPDSGICGLLLLHVNHSGRPVYRPDSCEPGSEVPHHPHISAGATSPAPFRGGPSPPVIIDESHHAPSHAQPAPMAVDHIPHSRMCHLPTRDTWPLCSPCLTSDPHPRNSGRMCGVPPHDSYYSRASCNGSTPLSPPVHITRPRSPTYHCYPSNRVVPSSPTDTHRSPRAYPQEPGGTGPGQGAFHTPFAGAKNTEATHSVFLTPSLPSASHLTASPAPDGGFSAEDTPPPA